MARSRSARTSYRCSFCGKTQEQVRRLIAGSGGVYICNECVGLCKDIINEEQTRTPVITYMPIRRITGEEKAVFLPDVSQTTLEERLFIGGLSGF